MSKDDLNITTSGKLSENKKADELAVLKVRELFQPVVTAVSEDFIVEVIQK